MDKIADCLLKAENCTVAAHTADRDDQVGFIRLAAIWRIRALRLKLARRAAAQTHTRPPAA
ncbi:MAG TPA: hypothetical protein VGO52_11360 [Hyphomonadaceae bacterium]|jgi:hypothetical protein|nr:hypothetical protein [Hyphomonadaceae bacterium]